MVIIYIYRDNHLWSEENIIFSKCTCLGINKIEFVKTKEPIRVRRH